jgi:hypothetical protein
MGASRAAPTSILMIVLTKRPGMANGFGTGSVLAGGISITTRMVTIRRNPIPGVALLT